MADYNPRSKEKKQDKQVEQINIAPHSIEAEQAVLGGIMLSNDQWDNVVRGFKQAIFTPTPIVLFLSKWKPWCEPIVPLILSL